MKKRLTTWPHKSQTTLGKFLGAEPKPLRCYGCGGPMPEIAKSVVYLKNKLGLFCSLACVNKAVAEKTYSASGLYGKTVFVYRGRKYRLKDVAIDEYVQLPEEYVKAIDWKRIHKRLKNKIDRLLDLESK